MSLEIPTGFAQLSFIQAAQGDPDNYVCTLGVDVSAAGGDYEEVGNEAIEAWSTNILPGQSTILTLVGVDVIVGQDGGPPLTVRVPSGSTGGEPGDMLPQNNAVLVSKNTATPGRGGRGRMYIPLFLRGDQVDNIGIINGPIVQGLQAQLTGFYNSLVNPGAAPPSVSIPPVLLHSEGSLLAPSPISSFTVERVIATQRRRLRG